MRKWAFSLTLMCFIIGTLLALEFKPFSTHQTAPEIDRTEVLISLITNLEAETAASEEHLIVIRQSTEELIAEAAENKEETAELQQALLEAQLEAGLTPVEGPGIVITLDDNAAALAASPNDDPNRYVIHYDKLLGIINDLRSANAEAISINGQRVLASSEVRCVGNVILINTTRLAPPFEISAIGDVSALETAISNSTSYESLRVTGFPVGYRVTSIADPTIQLPAYTGSLSTNYLHLSEEVSA